jgi:DNA-binding NarL/FixJ family response regulator
LLSFPRFAGAALVNGEAKSSLMERIALLMPQQPRVMMMIRQGKLNKRIAHELSVGDSTVKAHVTEIPRKLGVSSRT